MNTSPAALTATASGWSSELCVAEAPVPQAGDAGAREPRIRPSAVTSRTTLSPLSAMNRSPSASSAVPSGWYSVAADGLAAVARLAVRLQRAGDDRRGAVRQLRDHLAPVFDTYTVPVPAETPAGRYRPPPGPVEV